MSSPATRPSRRAPASEAPASDPERAGSFPARIQAALDAGGLVLLLSIGHRTGLFDVMEGRAPTSAGEIARQAGLAERYVREWLAGLAAGGVVAIDDDADSEAPRYHLPDAHAAWLTRRGDTPNLAAAAQWIPLLGSGEDAVVDCFASGRGLEASAFPRMPAIRQGESARVSAEAQLGPLLSREDALATRLGRGIRVLDLACGQGGTLLRLARSFPRSRFEGWEQVPGWAARARSHAERQGLEGTRFEERPPESLSLDSELELVLAVDLLPEQAHPGGLLARVARALRPGGVLLLRHLAASGDLQHDRRRPMATFLYAVSCLYSTPVAQGSGGEGVGAMAGRRAARSLLEEAGFSSLRFHRPPGDPVHEWIAATRPG